ncbi:hypothetical protein K432DRAFT_440727 [Lepidopterella palustris CBS 459.81]|uniref:Tubulin-specific chaperone D C-terminal domain-containing protein n=1 Tax=Lepidopterella palustris CBS 459.81 TaxID=1314670 RepID=A0A8E2EGK6_9PEZI|nr:hypothetical protein K432DRAFT_440727 [Lepidopterella palustris CBS 459.81]
MNAADDEDIKLQRASTSLLSDLQALLNKALWKKPDSSGRILIHRRVREKDLDRIFTLVEPFQEDPQLLDSQLKHFIPPLVAAYLEYLQVYPRPSPKKKLIPLSHAVCRILNLFCKVRGEKVIASFLNNEPRYLEPILTEFEKGEKSSMEHQVGSSQKIIPWEERYMLLLWLSHLMLAPFPLASISALQLSQDTSKQVGMDLPPELPGVALRVLPICVKYLESATKERNASGALLIRLSVRPDMRKIGLLDALVQWALAFFNTTSEKLFEIHQCLGVLSFLSGLVASATNQEIGPFLPHIYKSCQQIINQNALIPVKSSAVARKLVIKTLRNIVVHALQTFSIPNGLDIDTTLEEVIDFLLESLADGDTPVRYAASKALSVVTLKLEPAMAGEVVEAILGSLNENVYWEGSKRSLSGVNPLKWHGLTLTLAHLLYRRAPSADQLPDIINALLLALAFEQRSPTGGSIGTNVRDAACFGIWALSRRYITKDLLSVRTTSIRASHKNNEQYSVPQVLAIELLVAACLDPAGNIRRGSSAALQELIGRHPDTVLEGISLVQTVDFHAVGLRDRAMCSVAIEAAQLGQIYWDAIFEHLLEWRGVGSLDTASRISAANAIGLLSRHQQFEAVAGMVDKMCQQLKDLPLREVEERHGLVISLAFLINQSHRQSLNQILASKENQNPPLPRRTKKDLGNLTQLWTLFDTSLRLEEKAFISPALRPELTGSAICNLLGELARISFQVSGSNEVSCPPSQNMIELLNLCLGRNEESVLQTIPTAAIYLLELTRIYPEFSSDDLICSWLKYLEQESSYAGLRGSGYVIALGAVYSRLEESVANFGTTDYQTRIIQVLAFRCSNAVDIPARTVALQSLRVLLEEASGRLTGLRSPDLPQEAKNTITTALNTTLNDYTITERGDVGSLVRLEALNTTETAWTTGLLKGSEGENQLHAAVLRLSVEKLDKVRARAAHCLESGNQEHFERAIIGVTDGVSSYAYFKETLKIFNPSSPEWLKWAIVEGYISSAGMGSESVVQNSRMALVDTIDKLPVDVTPNDARHGCSLLDATNILLELIKWNLANDRILIPLLEVIAFLFDAQILQRLVGTSFSFRSLLSLVQKSHYKSTNIHKLHIALEVYRGLAEVDATRTDVISKVASMLLHPFPKIRISAAETLWIITENEDLKLRDWSQPPKNLKVIVEDIKKGNGVAQQCEISEPIFYR